MLKKLGMWYLGRNNSTEVETGRDKAVSFTAEAEKDFTPILYPGAIKPFPPHWGDPPKMQVYILFYYSFSYVASFVIFLVHSLFPCFMPYMIVI